MASRVTLKKNYNLRDLVTPTKREMTKVASFVATDVRDRAFPGTGAGRDENGKAYSGYGRKRIYVSKKSPPRPADMPAPRGGSKMVRKLKKAAKTVRYDGGYSQYRASIGRSSGANKNLVLTGQTARAMNVLEASPRGATIGFVRRRARAVALDTTYRFMGLTKAEAAKASAYLADVLAARRER